MEFKKLKKGLENLGFEIVSQLKSKVPVDTGKLKKSIKVRIKKSKPPVMKMSVSFKDYGVWLDSGTKPGRKPPPIKAIKAWCKRKKLNPYAVQKNIMKFGTKPQPWIDYQKVIDDNIDSLKQLYILDLKKYLKNYK
jgi:hypothetical protein